MKRILLLLLLLFPLKTFSQGMNHVWLLGYGNWANKGRILFDSSSYSFQIESRKMGFQGTEATICDDTGKFLISSNGVWIANANNDTMLNGSGLNPGPHVDAYPDGLLYPYGNILLPYPGDSSKIALIHHTMDVNGISFSAYQVFMSIVDLMLDGGLGGVLSKNTIIFSDTLNPGISACKHANGRDWWICMQKNNTDSLFTFLLTPNGVESILRQKLNVPIALFNVTELSFSPDGNKFVYNTYDTTSFIKYHYCPTKI